MPDGSATLTLTLHANITEIDAADWDACAGEAIRSSATRS